MSVVKKIMLTIAVILLFHFVLPQIPVYQSLMETSKEQIERNEDHEDVRLNAYEFYIYKNQTNALTPFFGNGVPSFISPWGKRFETEIIHEHAFAVDVGWAGFYWYFGFFTTLALFLLLCRAIRKRKSKDNKYAINQYTLYDAYRDGDAYTVGVSYAIGPFTTGISYFDSKSNVSKNRDKIVSFSNSYDYNKNTTFSFIVAHLESVGENNNNINNSKGYAFILGLELNL
jgi:hypothetical protein